MRACNNNNCPVGIATQDPRLRERIVIERAAARLTNFLLNTTEMMKVMGRACGYSRLADFNQDDLSTWKQEMASLAGIAYAGDTGRQR